MTTDAQNSKQKQQKEAQTQRYPHFTTGKNNPPHNYHALQTKPNVIQLCFV